MIYRQGIYQKQQQHNVPGPCGHTIKGNQGVATKTPKSFSLTDSNHPPNSAFPSPVQSPTHHPSLLYCSKIKGKAREIILIKIITPYFLASKGALIVGYSKTFSRRKRPSVKLLWLSHISISETVKCEKPCLEELR